MSQDISRPAVNSHNEWDLLEEVIVGEVRGAYFSKWDAITHAVVGDPHHPAASHQAEAYPQEVIEAADREVQRFVEILEDQGVTVRRPEPAGIFGRPYATPFWEWPCGKHAANPRDVLIVFGDQIIEVPTPRRSRHYEVFAYRSLLREYSRRGARWTAAPRPMLTEELFVEDFKCAGPGEELRYPLTEFEPVFDGADFVRCGRDIFYQRSFVTNEFGVDWLRQQLGSGYRFHEIKTACRTPVHIDTTFVPLAPGRALANPEFLRELPPILKKWDILWAPEPVLRGGKKAPFQLDSGWLAMNVLSLDEKRVIVDAEQEQLIRKLKDWGFEPIRVPFQSYYSFGGGFHCCTLDVRRRGELQSYF